MCFYLRVGRWMACQCCRGGDDRLLVHPPSSRWPPVTTTLTVSGVLAPRHGSLPDHVHRRGILRRSMTRLSLAGTVQDVWISISSQRVDAAFSLERPQKNVKWNIDIMESYSCADQDSQPIRTPDWVPLRLCLAAAQWIGWYLLLRSVEARMLCCFWLILHHSRAIVLFCVLVIDGSGDCSVPCSSHITSKAQSAHENMKLNQRSASVQ